MKKPNVRAARMSPARTTSQALFSRRKRALTGLALAVAFAAPHQRLAAEGPAPLNFRSAAPFSILAATTVTTQPSSSVNGDVGLSPGTGAAMQMTQGQTSGTIYVVDAAGPPGSVIAPALLTAAMGDLGTAYNDAANLPAPTGAYLNPGAGNIGSMTLGPGLYKFDGTALITGSGLFLSGGPDDVWIFQVGTDLQVGNGMIITLAGGAVSRNIFWQVGTSAVLGTTCQFKGTILAHQSITMNTGSTMEGRAMASNGAVTYDGTGGTIPTPEAPAFTDVSRTTSGDVILTVKTTPYFRLTLETSTDLTPDSWSVVTVTTPQTSPWTFTHDALLATGPKRFYRAFLTSYNKP